MNCDFISGSVAEVERLWYIAMYILLDHRKGASPIAVEALLFLKINLDYLYEQLVKKAMHQASNERAQRAIEEDVGHQEP